MPLDGWAHVPRPDGVTGRVEVQPVVADEARVRFAVGVGERRDRADELEKLDRLEHLVVAGRAPTLGHLDLLAARLQRD